MNQKEMVKKFLCPGCVCGKDTDCGRYKPYSPILGGCEGHVLGTTVLGTGAFALGMPKGFDRPSRVENGDPLAHSNKMVIHLFPKGVEVVDFDLLYNVPVWKLVRDGCLFVRFALPRIGGWIIRVIEDGDPAAYPTAIDMTPHYGEYD